MTKEEKIDLANTIQKVGDVMKEILHKKYISVTIQDGPLAGQTVPHVHAHVFVKNNTSDEVFCSQSVPDEKRIENSNLYRSYFQK
ncbi:histidine triad (hit) protein [Tritrichomonas foetus]|uniref:Histidine triad (Hit) protein n=1 Tax=Tritrichomonas foetus TaxID=1144522 RepID=A0A1J4KMU6_9EUKA|nr:histidine triad (hit) protein [Tritrichomonas foetus]|eukprot:OHT11124.1 histidine triad (hit) protein [Tritrichomonas foetus]